jgi:hypothetical protein
MSKLDDADRVDLAKRAEELVEEAEQIRRNSEELEDPEQIREANEQLDEALSEPLETLRRIGER